MRSDEDLVLAVRRGDLTAFDALYARYSGRLVGYLTRLLGDRQAAEDVCALRRVVYTFEAGQAQAKLQTESTSMSA